MTRLVQLYLERAKEAEGLAHTLTDDLQRRRWQEIASGYRNLAQARLATVAALERPPRLPASRTKSQT